MLTRAASAAFLRRLRASWPSAAAACIDARDQVVHQSVNPAAQDVERIAYCGQCLLPLAAHRIQRLLPLCRNTSVCHQEWVQYICLDVRAVWQSTLSMNGGKAEAGMCICHLQHMTTQLLRLDGRVVAIVGHCHLQGIEQRWRAVTAVCTTNGV